MEERYIYAAFNVVCFALLNGVVLGHGGWSLVGLACAYAAGTLLAGLLTRRPPDLYPEDRKQGHRE